jgi:hypothetical protein
MQIDISVWAKDGKGVVRHSVAIVEHGGCEQLSLTCAGLELARGRPDMVKEKIRQYMHQTIKAALSEMFGVVEG